MLDDDIRFARSSRADLKLVRAKICRRFPHDIVELADEVSLIGQATGVSGLCP